MRKGYLQIIRSSPDNGATGLYESVSSLHGRSTAQLARIIKHQAQSCTSGSL